MATILRYLEFLSLGTWVGSIIFLSFVVAPGAFAKRGSRDQAGAVVGMALGRLHLLGLIAGVLFLVARAALSLHWPRTCLAGQPRRARGGRHAAADAGFAVFGCAAHGSPARADGFRRPRAGRQSPACRVQPSAPRFGASGSCRPPGRSRRAALHRSEPQMNTDQPESCVKRT